MRTVTFSCPACRRQHVEDLVRNHKVRCGGADRDVYFTAAWRPTLDATEWEGRERPANPLVAISLVLGLLAIPIGLFVWYYTHPGKLPQEPAVITDLAVLLNEDHHWRHKATGQWVELVDYTIRAEGAKATATYRVLGGDRTEHVITQAHLKEEYEPASQWMAVQNQQLPGATDGVQ